MNGGWERPPVFATSPKLRGRGSAFSLRERRELDLDLIGRSLIGLGAALVCIGAFFMLRSRAPRSAVEEESEPVLTAAEVEQAEQPHAAEAPRVKRRVTNDPR
jgi:hypothetical protein